MNIWQLQEAKAKLTQLINDAEKEPQIISRHGVQKTVVMSIGQYAKLTKQNQSIVNFLRASPLCGIDLDLERDQSGPRDIDL